MRRSQLVYGSESNLDRPPSDMGTVQSRGCDRPTGFCFQLCSLVSPHFDWGVCQYTVVPVGLRSFPVRYRVWRPSPIHVGVSDLCQCPSKEKNNAFTPLARG